MGLTYSQVNTKSSSRIKIDNKEFCDAFAAYGAQVTETAGDVFQCKVGLVLTALRLRFPGTIIC